MEATRPTTAAWLPHGEIPAAPGNRHAVRSANRRMRWIISGVCELHGPGVKDAGRCESRSSGHAYSGPEGRVSVRKRPGSFGRWIGRSVCAVCRFPMQGYSSAGAGPGREPGSGRRGSGLMRASCPFSGPGVLSSGAGQLLPPFNPTTRTESATSGTSQVGRGPTNRH